MARVFSEAAWKSEKIDNIQPVEWRPEYAWLYSLALADGTFEAAPKLVWSAAYACVRPDWNITKVGQLLDELVRVGLLIRTQDETGKVWGRWVGSEKFLPTPERCKTKRYKTGRRDLFTNDGAAPPQHQDGTAAAPPQHPQGLGVGVGVGVGFESDSDSDQVLKAAMSSENEQLQPQKQVREEEQNLSPKPTPKTPRLRKVVPREEFESKREEKEFAGERAKTAALVKELKAEFASKPIPVFTAEELKRMAAKKR